MNGRVGVIAVHRRPTAVLGVIAVAVRVGAGRAGAALVNLSVAVVVFSVAADLVRVGIDFSVGVVAVDALIEGVVATALGVEAVFIRVGAGRGSAVLVDPSVAVIVDAVVADFRHPGADGGIGVIAVDHRSATAFGIIAVAIRVSAGRNLAAFIDLGIAVVIDVITAGLCPAWINGGIGVVAVGVVGYIPLGKRRRFQGCIDVPIPVSISVPVISHQHLVIMITAASPAAGADNRHQPGQNEDQQEKTTKYFITSCLFSHYSLLHVWMC